MTSGEDDELAVLMRQIAEKATHVQHQEVLIEVLERDGHDVSDRQRELAKERSHLATRIARQFKLLDITSARGGHEPSSSSKG